MSVVTNFNILNLITRVHNAHGSQNDGKLGVLQVVNTNPCIELQSIHHQLLAREDTLFQGTR